MQLFYRDILLRDPCEADIEAQVRWNTTQTAWGDWDAPWEGFEDFDAGEFRQNALRQLHRAPQGPRWRMMVATAAGQPIGTVNAYLMDEDYNWTDDDAPGQVLHLALGVDICEEALWGRGLGTQALAAWVRYHLDCGHRQLYTQTWSGNLRMVRCAQRLGFAECARKPGQRQVRGGLYDGLTFALDAGRFAAWLYGTPPAAPTAELQVPAQAAEPPAQRGGSAAQPNTEAPCAAQNAQDAPTLLAGQYRCSVLAAQDIGRVIPLYIRYYNHREGGCWTETTTARRIRQVLAAEDGFGLLLEDGAGAIGFVIGRFEQYADLVAFDLVEIVVAGPWQNRGLGSLLLQETERRVKEKGAAMVQLQAVNDAMHMHFYQKHRYYTAQNFVLMAKFLPGETAEKASEQ